MFSLDSYVLLDPKERNMIFERKLGIYFDTKKFSFPANFNIKFSNFSGYISVSSN